MNSTCRRSCSPAPTRMKRRARLYLLLKKKMTGQERTTRIHYGRALPWHRADVGFLGAYAPSGCARVRDVLLRADRHALRLAGLVRLAAPPVSSPETERTDTLDAPQNAA